MAIHTIQTAQFLPVSIEQAWSFLSSPSNLKLITPEYMGFDIVSGFKEGEEMYAGQIITYKVKPLLGIKTSWVTEITHVDAPYFFVDEQRIGPYKLWHHQHRLEESEGGVWMFDTVNYVVPLGLLGDILQYVLIRKKLKSIFDYRHKKLEELF